MESVPYATRESATICHFAKCLWHFVAVSI